jgi:hypothetical protein
VSSDPLLARRHRYRSLLLTAPYIYRHGLRRRFRQPPEAGAALSGADHPELSRVVHDVYCDMFLRGYTQAVGMPTDRLTGLAVALFAAFMYVFDDEFEARLDEPGAATDVHSVMTGAGVAQVWGALERYCSAVGRWEPVRDQILDRFLLSVFDGYREKVAELRAGGGGLDTARAAVEIDSGMTLRTAYHIIRVFNGHPVDRACEEQFRLLGVGGKFMDDLSDFRADVAAGGPNLLWCFLREDHRERDVAVAALDAAEPLTPHWWNQNCPRTYGRYWGEIVRYYRLVTVPGLRLPLDIFLALLGTRRFWRVSTVRAPVR